MRLQVGLVLRCVGGGVRTRNPNYRRAADTVLGRTSPRRAGSRGITFRDATTEAHPVVDLLVIGGALTDNDDGTAVLTINGSGVTVVGTVTADGSPFTMSSGADFRGFPGAAWLTNPTATEHTTGDKFLIVYYHGNTHLTNSRAVGKIATVTSTLPWTYTLGSEFDIENITADIRCDDAVSVLDIGGGDYRAVVAAREFNGTANHSPHILICDTSSATMTSASTWTRYNVGLSGHTQDLLSGRVLQLQDGSYLCAAYHITGATTTTAVVKSSSITNWTSPTIVNITTGYNEIDVEEVTPATLIAHMRNVPDTHIGSSTSTNGGTTWSAPTNIFTGKYFPTWRVLNSGLGLSIHADTAASDVTIRQTQSGVTDTGWGSETILDSGGAYISAYGTLLQLDNNHVLAIYGLESTEPDPIDSDLYSQVLTDSSVVASGSGTVTVQDEGSALANAATSLNFVGDGVTASGTSTTKTITIPGATAAVVAALGFAGEILITDTPSTPLVFADLLQNEAQDDLVYANV